MILMNIEYNVWLGHDSTTLCDSTRLEIPVTRDSTRTRTRPSWLVTRLGTRPKWLVNSSGIGPQSMKVWKIFETFCNKNKINKIEYLNCTVRHNECILSPVSNRVLLVSPPHVVRLYTSPGHSTWHPPVLGPYKPYVFPHEQVTPFFAAAYI